MLQRTGIGDTISYGTDSLRQSFNLKLQ